ncbi:ribosome silencing factor [uncultured Mucilaginibacter sp.]|uniref:ribosome silencing factor n=1 Tax=uncultured Mucilaginibacter sp. TaxID=797541 RepID=UPI0025FCA8C2|nr:ribosome silencing factor [uncultured Mucilaginibacter sp.]
MVKNKVFNESSAISELAVYGIQEKKGNDIIRLDLRNVNSSVADYFVICHADSATQVKAIANSVEEEIYKNLKLEPRHKEGLMTSEWIILDYFDVVIHIFRTDKREFYGVEDLWGDAEIKFYQSA